RPCHRPAAAAVAGRGPADREHVRVRGRRDPRQRRSAVQLGERTAGLSPRRSAPTTGTRFAGASTAPPAAHARACSGRCCGTCTPGPPAPPGKASAPPRHSRSERPKNKVLLPTEGREAHGRPGRIVVLEATKRGRPWPKWIVCPSWVAGRVIAYGIGVRRIGAASPGRCWNWPVEGAKRLCSGCDQPVAA